ncbi:MAG: integration host factor subunit beta [Bacteroidetes bacterium]|nr:integration host factor subunit beta [Bacteroidota bacterium]
MTKTDLVNEIAIKTGLDKVVVQETVETFFRVVKNSMAGGHNIYIRGFGTFQVKKRGPKKARDLQKNTTITITEHFVPKFKPAKEFIDRVKNAQAYPDLNE